MKKLKISWSWFGFFLGPMSLIICSAWKGFFILFPISFLISIIGFVIFGNMQSIITLLNAIFFGLTSKIFTEKSLDNKHTKLVGYYKNKGYKGRELGEIVKKKEMGVIKIILGFILVSCQA